MTRQGKLIVFEGTDGSGKTTQIRLLSDWLRVQKIDHQLADFPQYGRTVGANLIAKYLRGEFGDVNTVSPWLSSLAYAVDRFESRRRLKRFLEAGRLVIANRYVGSNLAHQAAKLPNEERSEFIAWLEKLEYEVFGIPKEDLVIFLHTPAEVGQRLVTTKGEREYLGGGHALDIHEANLAYLTETEAQFLELCQSEGWEKVECVVDGSLRTTEEINREVLTILQKRGMLAKPFNERG